MAKKGIPVRVHAHAIPAGKTFEFPEGTQLGLAGATGTAGGAAIVVETIRDGGLPAVPVDVTGKVEDLRESANDDAE
jgi:hypothetical protein